MSVFLVGCALVMRIGVGIRFFVCGGFFRLPLGCVRDKRYRLRCVKGSLKTPYAIVCISFQPFQAASGKTKPHFNVNIR